MFYTFTILLMFSNLFGNFESDQDFFNQHIDSEYFIDDPSLREKETKKRVEMRDETKPLQMKNGIVKAFYPDGKLKSEIGYRDGRKDGVEKIFYSDGKLKSEIGYRDGRKDGMEKIFYSDGKLKSETSYRDDRKDGIEKIFYSDGRIRSEIEYQNGKKIRSIFIGY